MAENGGPFGMAALQNGGPTPWQHKSCVMLATERVYVHSDRLVDEQAVDMPSYIVLWAL